jgi:hypothetical protein
LKRRELIKKIEGQGGVLIRHGGKHDWYQNPVTKVASRCRDTTKSTNISRGVSCERYPNRDVSLKMNHEGFSFELFRMVTKMAINSSHLAGGRKAVPRPAASGRCRVVFLNLNSYVLILFPNS